MEVVELTRGNLCMEILPIIENSLGSSEGKTKANVQLKVSF